MLISRSSQRLLLAAVLAAIAALPTAIWAAMGWAEAEARNNLRAEAQHRLALYSANLQGQLEKVGSVPQVLARDSEIAMLLNHPEDSQLADRINHKLGMLESASAPQGMFQVLYVMDRRGNTLAASNWDSDGSFVGQNFAYRPYFQAAIDGGVGRYFALGTTSNIPGYYVAYPIVRNSQVIGVVVMKVALEGLEHNWASSADRIFVTDANGIIFITNINDWRYKSLSALPGDVLERVQSSLQYSGADIRSLDVRSQSGESMTIGGETYMVQSAYLPGSEWKLHVLMSMEPVAQRMIDGAIIAGAGAVIVIFVVTWLLQRRLALRRRIELEAALREELEQRMRERTAELRARQNELVQAGKLAALGQMSAGIAHELNQPLAAIRSYADNARILLERERFGMVKGNLEEISGLTERMARISQQLKTFARKSSGRLEPISAQQAIDRALSLVSARIEAEDVAVHRESAVSSPDLAIMGEDVRLEQVLVNLLRNALDAMSGAARRVLFIGLRESGEDVILEVRDSGAGISDSAMPQLFYPFFTTKGVGEGLGLGLSISYGIIQDFGGTITAANHAEGGAVFTIALRKAPSLQQAQ